MHLLPRKKSKITTREKIKQATFELLAEKGCASVSARDITKRANTAVGQLTYYYKTKESLILEVLDDTTKEFLSEFNETIKQSDKKVEAATDFFNEAMNEQDDVCKIIIDIISQSVYINQFTKRASTLIDELTKSMTIAYGNEKDLNSEQINKKAIDFINSIIGTIIRKNAQENILKIEELDEEEFEETEQKTKKLSMKVLFE